ncbi:HK97 gp10 family phage protein [Marinilactibacillus psychrotolerans]|uniref:HK97 gp10 family phage protein n=1 Tax=Marinilactibacillus psychrotolerans TaxID=191770 RepID=A0A5R9C069_9LACT|nr:HK97 gp10 family phage protein [Marinilactibacillus psychrotolerans]TLQ06062.1 HK97 gp10 family phage protein [Marinilactibacillus psychrotolerans]
MKVKYRMKGMNQFYRQVRKTSENTQKAVQRELALSSLRVERKAKMLAPWDTGWMSMNIYSDMVSAWIYEVVSPVEYSIYQELGTRYMAAQPFMYPALQEEYWTLMRRLSKIMK